MAISCEDTLFWNKAYFTRHDLRDFTRKNCEKGSLIFSPNVEIRGAAAFKAETQTQLKKQLKKR